MVLLIIKYFITGHCVMLDCANKYCTSHIVKKFNIRSFYFVTAFEIVFVFHEKWMKLPTTEQY